LVVAPLPPEGRRIAGGYTFTDALNEVLAHHPWLRTSLERASDEELKLAAHLLLSDPETSDFLDALALTAERERGILSGYAADRWSAPALVLTVGLDNRKLGGGLQEISVGGDSRVLDRERLQRNMQRLLRGDQETYRLWAVGVDPNLQAQDDGERAGPFIMLTVIAALAMVGITLRSYWAVALTGAGLGILMIWLKGGANLIGIKGGLVVDLIVPIAMVSLGVDFAIHALRRYREEGRQGRTPRAALRIGFTGVLGALALAMLSGSIAFLANVTSPIEAVTEFGIATALAVMTAFVVLGVGVPLAYMRVDELAGSARCPRGWGAGSRGRILAALGGIAVAASSGTGVILLVALDELVGVLAIFASMALTVALPYTLLHRTASRTPRPRAAERVTPISPSGVSDARWLAFVVSLVGRHGVAVSVVTVIVTGIALGFALRLDTGMDVQQFFSSDSDLVVGLNKLEEHAAQHQREAAHIYIRGDLTDPQALTAIHEVKARIGESPHVFRGEDGDVRFEPNLLELVADLLDTDHALQDLRTVTGVDVSDTTGDGLPDSAAQLVAAYDYLIERGLPRSETSLLYEPLAIRQFFDHVSGGNPEQATLLSVPILGTRAPETVRAAQRELKGALSLLEDVPSIAFYGVTGPAFTRQATLDATTDSLQRSMPVAAVAVFAMLLISMRSWRYAVVTIIPVALVAAWLYGLMGLLGFDLNIVTATIGAVSIGVGVDFAIHLTERFREELGRADEPIQALNRAANGTGVALLTSAASSIVGFSIMAFAPMPLFASYGMLTALMILFAVSASLLVLPSLLIFVAPAKRVTQLRSEANASPGEP
jgi:uncharacterized protein